MNDPADTLYPSDAMGNDALDYLSPLSFIDFQNTDWQATDGMDFGDSQLTLGSQWPEPNATCSPSDLIGGTSSQSNSSFEYDFSFRVDGPMPTGLPSPPSTSSMPSPNSQQARSPSLEASKLIPYPSTDLTKVPIPRLPRPAFADPATSAVPSKRSKAADSDAPPKVRTKTSHTTIERRYRTNLNARITGLRQAVPALRVLDKSYVPVNGIKDPIDDRGYVDGVKAARKGSKATVLGKATEYITVLKRREARLRGELAAIKSLFVSLVPGGDAVLMSWETAYTSASGGERADEVPIDEIEDDEDEDEEEGADETAPAPPKKRAKVEKADEKPKEQKKKVSQVVTIHQAQPEKRKRGRPKKVSEADFNVVLAPTQQQAPMQLQSPEQSVVHPMSNIPDDISSFIMHSPMQPVVLQPEQPARYLLAAFVFFSFFRTPSQTPSPAATHHHQGAVLNALPTPVATTGWTLNDFVQVVHLLVSLLLVLSLVAPYLPTSVRASKMFRTMAFVGPNVTPTIKEDKKDVKTSGPQLSAMRDQILASHVVGVLGSVRRYIAHRVGLRTRDEDGQAWFKVAESLILSDEKLSFLSRLQLFFLCTTTVDKGTEASSFAILSILTRPLSASYAKLLWSKAQARAEDDVEKVALDGSLKENIACLGRRTVDLSSDGKLLDVLATLKVAECLAKATEELFLERVLGSPDAQEEHEGKASMKEQEQSLRAAEKKQKSIFRVGEILGGDLRDLVQAYFALRSSPPVLADVPPSLLSVPPSTMSKVQADAHTFLSSVYLLHRLFPSHTLSSLSGTTPSTGSKPSSVPAMPLSPPPSPLSSRMRSKEEAKLLVSLRCILATDVFERAGGRLEEGRDAVADLII
ncbi:hypothetical protein SISSUDRAFT_1064594 [Sistotremastrum suecicum HHB10207 ss-3]|uniref:BHLH domain-containing protein n=1 Tax=Sistotremastrum suecicum HHB10207 ss-3 TaxID=1314776 RepID=A0A166AGV3_9AGAM|nr:hypothetical protein SISSUDRAFT_1064594 [Sistotremastrum suecicum HHB10207 ss-3]